MNDSFLKPIDLTGDIVGGDVLVRSAEIKTAKSGKPYLDMIVFNGVSERLARFFGYRGELPRVGSVIYVEGINEEFRGMTQLKVSKIDDPTDPDASRFEPAVISVNAEPRRTESAEPQPQEKKTFLPVIDPRSGLEGGDVLVRNCERKTSKTGAPYLDLVLSNDDFVEISAKMFSVQSDVDPVVNTVIYIEGKSDEYQGKPQFKINKFAPAKDPSVTRFTPRSKQSSEYMYGEILKVVEGFTDEDYKKLTLAVLDKFKSKIFDMPAALKLHHAYGGGLLTHTLTMLRLAQAVAGIYQSVYPDLLYAGVILHDIEKSDEFTLNELGLVSGYSVRGTLLGHLVMGVEAVDKIGRELGVPEDKLVLVEHMIASHHGVPEFGACVRPLFLEAEILSQIDTLDSKIFEIEAAASVAAVKDFSAKQWALDDRKFFNHGLKKPTTDVNI